MEHEQQRHIKIPGLDLGSIHPPWLEFCNLARHVCLSVNQMNHVGQKSLSKETENGEQTR